MKGGEGKKEFGEKEKTTSEKEAQFFVEDHTLNPSSSSPLLPPLPPLLSRQFFVVRREDEDEIGRHLVGVESGPYDTLEVRHVSLKWEI
jgi:hypothetical protein